MIQPSGSRRRAPFRSARNTSLYVSMMRGAGIDSGMAMWDDLLLVARVDHAGVAKAIRGPVVSRSACVRCRDPDGHPHLPWVGRTLRYAKNSSLSGESGQGARDGLPWNCPTVPSPPPPRSVRADDARTRGPIGMIG